MNQIEIKNQIEEIKKMSIFGLIDKINVVKHFNISSKTAERRIKQANLTHCQTKLINMAIDISDGKPTKEISIKYGCSEVNVNAFARRHSLQNRHIYRHINYRDPYYFDNINSEAKAYILGFIAADGHVSDKEIKISLSIKDIDILYKIKSEIGFNNKIRIDDKFCHIGFGISEMINSLRKLGLKRNKTVDFKFPKINDEFIIPFIRGYFDGDGSFSEYKSNDGYTRYCFSFCGTQSFLNDLRDVLSNFQIKTFDKMYKRFDTENCCYSLNGAGKENILRFLNLIYSDSSICLDRKYNKWINICNKMRTEKFDPAELYRTRYWQK
jgi:hypothetical protein|nr:MAG TPA: LAGLIDADG-like domain [Caudoviricetes sp.]